MNLSEEIIAALRARNAAGETYDRMEKLTGVSGSYIHRIATHQSDPLKLSLEKFLALFPSAQISLSGTSFELAPDSALRHEREKLELERALLAAERRELEQTRKNLELEKENLELRAQSLLSTPRAPHAAEPAAPYRVEPCISSPSTK